MIGAILVLAVLGLLTWLGLNIGTSFAATKLNFLEADAPTGGGKDGGRDGGRSALRVRYGPLRLSARHVLLAEKSLKLASGFLVGLYPVDITQVRVDEYKIHFGWGLRKFIKSWWQGEGRERLAPKLVIRLVGVRVSITGNGPEDWEEQAEAMATGIEGMNHSQANALTALIDKTAPAESASPTMISKLVDAVVNALDIEVEGFHLSVASANHRDAFQEAAVQPGQQRSSGSGAGSGAGYSSGSGNALGKTGGKTAGRTAVGDGWVLGVKFDYFRLCKKANPSKETLGVTPRALRLKSFNLYYDIDGMPVRRSIGSADPADGDHDERGGGRPTSSSAAIRGHEDPGVLVEEGAAPTSAVLAGDRGDVSASLRSPDDHNSLMMVESIGGTFLFPDLMCVLLGAGRQPGGNGKIMAVNLEEIRGVVVELEPFQVFGLLNDAVPLLSMMGPYADWCADARLQWHTEAFARPPGTAGGVPSTPEELEKYAEALGSAPGDDGGEKKQKGDPAELAKLDKNMSLSQIMLTRMRVRKWDVVRPERVMTWANLLLNSIDPFQGVLAEDLAGDVAAPGPVPGSSMSLGGVGTGAGEEDGVESDEESPSVSSGQSEAVMPSLQTDGPEEDARLESLLYYVAQESACTSAEAPVLMEIDIRMSARDVTLLVFQPPREVISYGGTDPRRDHDAGRDDDSDRFAASDFGDDESVPESHDLSRQHSGGSVKLGKDSGELATEEALSLRDNLYLPALAASVVIDDFKFGFNMLMGSVPACVAPPETGPAAAAVGDDEGGGETGAGAPVGGPEAAAGASYPEEEGPVQLHTFSTTLFPDSRPIRLYKPSRLGQGADLRVESFGAVDEVGDGVAGMSLSLVLGGTRVTDFGALEDGGVLPTLIGGPAAAAASSVGASGGSASGSSSGSSSGDGDGKEDCFAAGGTTRATLALYTAGRLEAGLNFESCTVVALPGRIFAIIDVVLACLMGPPKAREAQEAEALEEEVEAEEAEEATGGVGTTEVVDARWKAIDKVRNAYLFLGRLDARFSVRVHAFSLVLPQDSRDPRTNVVMAQCSALTLNMKSGSAFEALAVDVHGFSLAPCVQRQEASDATIVACGRLHETGVAIALRGPIPDLLEVIHDGFPLKDLGLFPITARRIILPVNMKIKYSTYVTLRVEDTLEASTDNLVPDMMRINSATDLGDLDVTDQERQQFAAVTALSNEDEDRDGGGADASGDKPAAETPASEGDGSGAEPDAKPPAAEGGDGSKKVPAEAKTSPAEEEEQAAAEVQSGWYVLMEVQLHVSSGLHVKMTDLDVAVLQGIATSLIDSLGVGAGATAAGGAGAASSPAKTGHELTAGKSLTYALDKAQRRMVASLRQAFRLADVNGDGTLDRAEVEALLRHNLHGQSVDPAQTEAEVLQFIALLDGDGTDTLDIDEFTSTMMRLMVDGPDEVTLERARRQALTKAFKEADADGSGTLDVDEITELLKGSDPLRTRSELETQVNRYIEDVDVDGDGQLDLEEFIELVHGMRAGGVHEGPLEPKAEEFRSWEVIRPILEGFETLPELLAARPPDYSPPGFWKRFEGETHATREGPAGQLAEAVQAKMVKAFDNYGFASDAWSFLVAPAWHHGVVRVGNLSVVSDDASRGKSRTVGPQQMRAPVRPGALVYAQEQDRSSRWGSSAASVLTRMKIQRLPEELAAPPATPPAVDPQSPEASQAAVAAAAAAENYVTGVRLPAPPGSGRRRSQRGATCPPGVKMQVDRPCTLLVCFHDETASTGVDGGGDGGAAAATEQGSQMELPLWATKMGLNRTSMHIDTVLPSEDDGATPSHHVYRVFSTPVAAGVVELGKGMPGSLPYFVLLYGGSHLQRNQSRMRRRTSADRRRPVRTATDGGYGRRRGLRSSVRRGATVGPLGVPRGISTLGGSSGSSGGGGGTSINSLSGRTRGSSAGVVSSASLDRGVSGESIELTRTTTPASRSTAEPTKPERQSSAASTAESAGGGAAAAAVNTNPSWRLTPNYGLGGASRGMTSIATKADKNAKKAAGTALKIAAISSVGTSAGDAAGGGDGAGGVDVAKKPRVRLKMTLLCERGVLVQMDDLHRLENTPSDEAAAPTFELALKVPRQAGGAGGAGAEVAAAPPPPGGIAAQPTSMDESLSATLDFEHVASAEILGEQDSMSMKAAFGMEGRYFNPRVQQSEHFIEPWSMAIKMSDPRGDSTPRGEMIADRHFVLNCTTGLTSLACSIMESRDYGKTRYSTTSVYTELRDGTRDDDDGSRLLTIENHLGVPVTVTLEDDDIDHSPAAPATKSFRIPLKKSGTRERHSRSTSSASNYASIPASLYAGGGDGSPDKGLAGGNRSEGPAADRISVGELKVPDAKKSLPTATVTVTAEGFSPVTGVPLDLLGRGTHVYKMARTGERRDSKRCKFEGMVVKFASRPAREASVLDLAMQLQTNVSLKNDLPRHLRIDLGREVDTEPHTVVPSDAEICVPFPLLRSEVLRLWKCPRKMVGGDALKKALQEMEDGVPGDVGYEVSVGIPPTTFDRNKKVVERHSQSMLLNGLSVERADLAPIPGLVMHNNGDDAPALWRLYVRAPYVIQNGLACDIVVWASQPVAEPDSAAAIQDFMLQSPTGASSRDGSSVSPTPRSSSGSGVKQRLRLKDIGRSHRKEAELTRPSSAAAPAAGTKFKFGQNPWKNSSSAPYRVGVSPVGRGGVRGGGGDASHAFDEDSADDDDTDMDDTDTTTDTEIERHEEDDEALEEEEAELDRLSAIAGGGDEAAAVAGVGDDRPKDGRVLWVLKSGEEAKLEGMDMSRHLRIRIGFAPADGTSSCSDFCKSFIIEAKRHTNRTLLNKIDAQEAIFAHGARGSGGARRPEFKFGAVWEHTPGNRHIHVYSKVWVVNKTGVSLAYRANMKNKDDDEKKKVFVRRPHNACYRTDGDTLLFSRYMTGGSASTTAGGKAPGSPGGGGGSGGGKASLPLMLTCPSNTLQTMPYGMADSAVDAALLLSETRSSKAEQPLPCITLPEAGGHAERWWPLYCDFPPARVELPAEVTLSGRQRVHLLTLRSDTGAVSFSPSRDCRVYIGLDKRLLAPDPGPPKWLGLQGFEREERLDIANSSVTPADLAPEGFGLYSRFCRGLSVVPLGQNVNHDGDSVEGRKHRGSPAAMYFVVVVRVPESEAVAEVDIGPVVMHRSVGKYLEFREHHRWRIKPHFKPGDPIYNDRPASENTVQGLPEKLKGLKLMQILTGQGDKRVKANNMASFQLLQRSRVLVCFDSRASKPPSWLAAKGFVFQEDMLLPVDSTGKMGFMVFAKVYPEGAEVKLGGNKAKGAKRMYFVLVHTIGPQDGRISAPPRLATPVHPPPSPTSSELSAAAAGAPGGPNPNVFGDGGDDDRETEAGASSKGQRAGSGQSDSSGSGERREGSKKGDEREGGVAVGSKDGQVFQFWDNEANGKLVQAPLDLDRQGRGWCEPFATDAVKTAGQAKSPAGVFGVTVDALTGAFLQTRVVTVWPRFVVRNNLGREIGVLSTLEPPPNKGKDHGQSIAKVTQEELEDLKHVQRASRKATKAVPDGASVVLYDFTDPDDYEGVEDQCLDASMSSTSSGSVKPSRKQLQLWKRITKKDQEGKLPCVRLFSGVHKKQTRRKGSGGGSGGDGRDGGKRGGGSAAGKPWVELPTVPVLLESIGKDTYVWMEGGKNQDDVLVRVSCRMLSNGATVHVVLSNETPSPPLRIENRSSTQTLCYRLGGDADDNVRLLEPMRWNSLHWVNDDKRYIEAAVYTGKDARSTADSIHKRKEKVKDAARKGRDAFKARVHGGGKSGSLAGVSDSDSDDEDEDGGSDPERHAVTFSSFRWGSKGKFGDAPRREYTTEDVGRLKDLVGGKRKAGGEVRLKVECLRPPDSVVTTLLAFSDTPDGVYGTTSPDASSALALKDGQPGDADDEEGLQGRGSEVVGSFARIWTGLHFEAKFAGLVLNIIDSTPSGPSEMAAFTVDNFEFGKPSGTPRVTLSVWHFQLDDMRADSPHPIILAPQSSGFNSHLTKVHYNTLRGSPAFRVQLERDVQVSLTHDMWVIRDIAVQLGKVHCAVHVDFWIDVQDVVFASLNWTNSSPAEARARSIAETQGVVGMLLQAPAADASVDRIYIGSYTQAEIEVAVDFHLGTKVAALLSSKPPADGDEEKDEGGFGASLAMMPLGAAGGVVWGLLSSFGAGIANASPTFNFDHYELEHYYGSTTQAVRLVVMSFVKQGVVQAYKVLGHIDILGDPLSLGKNISSGVIGFVTKAGAGHIGEGSKDLVKGVVGGTASSASKMTDALDGFVREAGGMDADAPSGMEATKAPEHLGQGLTQGMLYFGHTVKDGIKGVVIKPLRGARKNGAAGFVSGVGKGMVGLVAAPVSAALGATSKIAASIDASTRLLDDEPMGRRREPRHPLGRGEREDRDRLKQERKKKAAAQKRRRRSGSSGGGDSDVGGDEPEVDVQAEAGGMGLLLTPLTPADFRANYSEDYIDRCEADMADRAGAVAIAREVEKSLATFPVVLDDIQEGTEEEEEGKEEESAATKGGGGGSGGDSGGSGSGAEETKAEGRRGTQ